MVPLMDTATSVTADADFFLVVGTSMVVYPAAGLINYVAREAPIYIIDPKIPDVPPSANIKFIAEKASTGMEKVKELLLAQK
jgi:NAD-dependent deacetylase